MKAPLDKLAEIDAARSQLATAINLFFNDVDPISVHSLACASAEILEAICRKNSKQTFFAHMRESNPKFTSKEIRETLNKSKNWFKHADKDHGDVLTDFSDVLNDYAIFMASHDYGSLENWKPIEIQVFQLWFSAVYMKHMDPRLEIVQQLFPDMDKKNRREQKLLGKNAAKINYGGAGRPAGRRGGPRGTRSGGEQNHPLEEGQERPPPEKGKIGSAARSKFSGISAPPLQGWLSGSAPSSSPPARCRCA
ncbi:MAG: hypothetical protein HY618_08235 [Candidatus Tectomicrobia bacterium]|uniref:Uncharacterized protein n=1 Tax=Tectimicrobiota bacterium TaxID=2528274 RepID=A0A932ZVB7_UNCTE|nr:hypothetical protein [Candidatus Tectomicrobia bacterium]